MYIRPGECAVQLPAGSGLGILGAGLPAIYGNVLWEISVSKQTRQRLLACS